MKIPFHKITNTAATLIIWLLTLVAVTPLVLVVGYVAVNGFRHLSFDLLTRSPAPVGETGGGVLNGIVGSVIILFTAGLAGIPLGILGGLYLSEGSGGRGRHLVRLCVEILQGVPSIVIGIVAYILLVVPMKRFSAIAGGIALGIMMLPVIVISTEEVLRLIPSELREAGIALGMPRWRVSLLVVMRTGMGGVLSGILISFSRVAGETAPLLFTALGSQFLSFRPDRPMAALPLQIFNYAISPYPEWHAVGFAASFLLLIVILAVNIATRTILARMSFSRR